MVDTDNGDWIEWRRLVKKHLEDEDARWPQIEDRLRRIEQKVTSLQTERRVLAVLVPFFVSLAVSLAAIYAAK